MNSTRIKENHLSLLKTTKWLVSLALAFLFATVGTTTAFAKSAPMVATGTAQAPSAAWLNKKVYDRLVTIPWYGVFDNLAYRIQGSKLTLIGQVVFPLSRSSVAAAVKGLPGVKKIVNDVQNLPFTPFDNQVRRAEYRSIFGYEPLFRYSMGVNPAIHIIVKNSRVTLVGVVNSKTDRQLAGIRAKMVPFVFSVKNDLRVG
jgi:hyperosmotically inducible protein